jgi:hypothetical protein
VQQLAGNKDRGMIAAEAISSGALVAEYIGVVSNKQCRICSVLCKLITSSPWQVQEVIHSDVSEVRAGRTHAQPAAIAATDCVATGHMPGAKSTEGDVDCQSCSVRAFQCARVMSL